MNGRRSTKEIAEETGRPHSSVDHDLRRLENAGLIEPRLDRDGEPVKKERSAVYQRVPLARTVSLKYFQDSVAGTKRVLQERRPVKKGRRPRRAAEPPLAVPSAQEIIDICAEGEDELHEFKGPGTSTQKITKEIAAFLNTRKGGLILYGVEDDGKIRGTDRRKATVDQSLQNSNRSNIDPTPPAVTLRSVRVVGTEIVVIVVPPWNRRDVYHFEDRVYIRKGTNAVPATAAESRRLHNGEYVV